MALRWTQYGPRWPQERATKCKKRHFLQYHVFAFFCLFKGLRNSGGDLGEGSSLGKVRQFGACWLAPWGQDGPKMAQDGPKTFQTGPEMDLRRPNMVPRWPKMAPRCAQNGPKKSKNNMQNGRSLPEHVFVFCAFQRPMKQPRSWPRPACQDLCLARPSWMVNGGAAYEGQGIY